MPVNCGFCGSGLHTRATCPSTWSGSAARARMRCTYCGGNDHNIKACPKTFGGNAARAWNPSSVADDFVKDGGR
ncbi:hypothetical protein MYSTI_01910 [Myxococcus stipitatus DSM 14675]|uniref:Zinc knuckle domain-containing protein n=1 Tax=Myxococcus stipitatus (strain DSM 14675 / JCM 12634 / Mx s8) TaxID=1278073 RepID=L7U381_MYXSD|nr:hypothetical protein MYSTI_01910 [Myxococcus stipitatus DSM 14675]